MRLIALAFIAVLCLGQTASTPDALPTDRDLLVASNRAETTLSAGVNSSILTLTVASTTNFVPFMHITIDTEIMQVCNVALGLITICADGRGAENTTAIAHSSGRPVRGTVTAWHHNRMREEVQALATHVADSRAYNFTLQGTMFTGDLSTAGVKTITIAAPYACPPGVNGSNTGHRIYISGGTGTPETPLITGGTCASGGTGTLQFTTVNTHAGSVISSATAGIQEAVFSVSGAVQVNVPTGLHILFAPISVTKGAVFIRGADWRLTELSASFTNDSIIKLGSAAAQINSVRFSNITLTAGGVMSPGTAAIVVQRTGVSKISEVRVFGNSKIYDGIKILSATTLDVEATYITSVVNDGITAIGTGGFGTGNEVQELNIVGPTIYNCGSDGIFLGNYTSGVDVSRFIGGSNAGWATNVDGNSGTFNIFLKNYDVEVAATGGGIKLNNTANVSIDGGWMGINGIGVYVAGTSTSVNISGMNLMSGPSLPLVNLIKVDGTATNVNITGNDLNGYDSATAEDCVNILATALNINVVGNTIRYCGVGIKSESATHTITQTGNNFANNTADTSGYFIFNSTRLVKFSLPGASPTVPLKLHNDVGGAGNGAMLGFKIGSDSVTRDAGWIGSFFEGAFGVEMGFFVNANWATQDPHRTLTLASFGGLKIEHLGVAPTCDASKRGIIWRFEGGSGVADTLEICRKDAGGSFAWVSLF